VITKQEVFEAVRDSYLEHREIIRLLIITLFMIAQDLNAPSSGRIADLKGT
jgi:hypothetical protein